VGPQPEVDDIVGALRQVGRDVREHPAAVALVPDRRRDERAACTTGSEGDGNQRASAVGQPPREGTAQGAGNDCHGAVCDVGPGLGLERRLRAVKSGRDVDARRRRRPDEPGGHTQTDAAGKDGGS